MQVIFKSKGLDVQPGGGGGGNIHPAGISDEPLNEMIRPSTKTI